jgi:hypothetical protein
MPSRNNFWQISGKIADKEIFIHITKKILPQSADIRVAFNRKPSQISNKTFLLFSLLCNLRAGNVVLPSRKKINL